MLRFRITFEHAGELLRTFDHEMKRGVMLVKVEPPPDLELRAQIGLEIATPAGAVAFASEVVQPLPTVGIAVSVPLERLDELRALAEGMAADARGEVRHEQIAAGARPQSRAPDAPPVSGGGATPAAAMARMSFAEKVQLALHGSKDDRAAILRDQNKQLHPFVLKSPNISPEEIAGFASSPQTSADFLKQIAERKEWLSRPAIALALARNPKTPAELAVRAVEHVPLEHLRQFAKGVGVPAHVTQAARRKVLSK